MHIVTGAAGFIGGHLVRALNARGVRDVIAVDDLTHGDKFRNLADCDLADYLDHREFRDLVRSGSDRLKATVLFHQGACADTTESDGRHMMEANFTVSKELLHWALERRVPFIYASSASVYGLNGHCVEAPACEDPLNVYAYSKLLFDRYARRHWDAAGSTVVGLRYFNVYGPGEAHKGRMASMVSQLSWQLREHGVARLFEGTDGYGDGEQRRDFVEVGDVAAVNLFFAHGPPKRTIVNVGTGRARSFNDVARALIARLGCGRIEYIPFPASLAGKYQSFTEADLTALRAAGYDRPFHSIEEGIDRLLEAEAAGERRNTEAAARAAGASAA